MDSPDKKSDEKISGSQTHGEPVWVQCEGFRCLAVRDKNGAWKTFYDGVPLSGAIEIALNNQKGV
jgi:hypothetical protein